MDASKYTRVPGPELANPKWVHRNIEEPPIWCSVCLRDGNQALAIPMTLERKLLLFHEIVRIGIKEIEVGYPAANATEYAFTRHLIENDLVPDGVSLQVLTMAREDLIDRTIDALNGAKKATIHFYVGTSRIFQDSVLNLTEDENVALAVKAARKIVQESKRLHDCDVAFEFSPEHFSSSHMPFVVRICDEVADALGSGKNGRIIINLPATVETCSPKTYANMVEWFCDNLRNRPNVTVSVHVHNDRGTGVAATELGLMAGADRVEGTLFGNGERTGNVDIVTVALNLFSDGVDPNIDLSNIERTVSVYEAATGMTVPPRQPYAGELVYTAFSGSHQDAIGKVSRGRRPGAVWDMPYLGLDPDDIGRKLSVVRINAQSGKGGVAHVLRADHHIELPRPLLTEFSAHVTDAADSGACEITSDVLYHLLRAHYSVTSPICDFADHSNVMRPAETVRLVRATIYLTGGRELPIEGEGNGFLSAFHNGIRQLIAEPFDIADEQQHSRGTSAAANAIAFVQISMNGDQVWGIAEHTSSTAVIVYAYISAVNRAIELGHLHFT